jgi:hypothetical protein
VLWVADDRNDVLRCTHIWQRAEAAVETFLRATQDTSLASCAGLAGQAWIHREPKWIADVSKDADFCERGRGCRVRAAQRGVGTDFPERGTWRGLMEFVSRQAVKPNDDVLQLGGRAGEPNRPIMIRKKAEARHDARSWVLLPIY